MSSASPMTRIQLTSNTRALDACLTATRLALAEIGRRRLATPEQLSALKLALVERLERKDAINFKTIGPTSEGKCLVVAMPGEALRLGLEALCDRNVDGAIDIYRRVGESES